MDVTVGTFNLNNLFSRFNFEAEIESTGDTRENIEGKVDYKYGPEDFVEMKIHTFMGKLLKKKEDKDYNKIVKRIRAMDVDVLAVQEVDDLDTLKDFRDNNFENVYKFFTLIEGNDIRRIDVGVLSKLPIGSVTSWKHWVHPDNPGRPVFARDLLQVDILNPSRSERLFTIFNNHLKSHYVDYHKDKVEEEKANSLKRSRQAEMIAKIVKMETRPDSRYIVLGDMNDPPDSPDISAFVEDPEMKLVNSLREPKETRPPKEDKKSPPPSSGAWTHRYIDDGKPAVYELYDHIWLSPALADKQVEAWIDRRINHGGDSSDHDPAWIKLRL